MVNPKKKPWLAGLLSFFVTGMGQIYNRQYKKGIILLVFSLFLLLSGGLISYYGFFTAATGIATPLVSIAYAFIIIDFCIWIYSIYNSYKYAKETVNKEPNNYVFLIAIPLIIIVIIFWMGVAYTFLVGSFSTSNSSSTAYAPSETRNQSYAQYQKSSNEFKSDINDAMLSLSASDTITARNKLSDSRTALYEMTDNWKSLCQSSTDKTCTGYTDLYDLCMPKYLDSLYSMTYIYDSLKKVQSYQMTKDDYKTQCNSWLNSYNIVKGSCDTISTEYNLNFTAGDLSSICNI